MRVDNIRAVLNRLAGPGNQKWKEQFRRFSPIPGARCSSEIPGQTFVLQNADQIFPVEYGVPQLLRDVQDYNNLLSRISKRLPPAFIRQVEWDGDALPSGLISYYPIPCRLKSTFEDTLPPELPPGPSRAKRKTADNRARDVEQLGDDRFKYVEDVLSGAEEVTKCWSMDCQSTPLDFVSGMASFVGERTLWTSRLEVNARLTAMVSTSASLTALVDATTDPKE